MNNNSLNVQERKKQVLRMLAVNIRKVFEKGNYDFSKLQEIRMRSGEPLMVVYDGEEYFVTKDGAFRKDKKFQVSVLAEDIRETMEYISNYSMYAFEKEIRQGYLTVAGGHRVGLAGKVIWERDGTKSIRYISFLNIRLAHEVKGCADRLMPFLIGEHGFFHTLLVSPPGCGKTTLLRDIVRQISDGIDGKQGFTVGVVDERSEIAACYQGKPQNDMGSRTDVLDDCPKSQGMMMLVRSMAPQVIAVDEIGSLQDAEAIRYIMNCGVKILATIHGSSIEEVRKKPMMEELVNDHIFERMVLLKSGDVGKIQHVFDENYCELRAHL